MPLPLLLPVLPVMLPVLPVMLWLAARGAHGVAAGAALAEASGCGCGSGLPGGGLPSHTSHALAAG